ncbi:DUF2951 family protein [Jeotgalicoccus halotolerans]|uniref:DUF2951 family protein n=1 Tax=Jeotgalicoccus halotolerans TaxID=157227 RepID=A0A3E0B026_9STAP|nr:DUF2951 family protein [Jeotgalicoccus halotolerans]REG25307.1 DUF2951 family protein [Jeotgalicoccus halotolerans]
MPASLEGHEKRLSRLERKDEHYEERFSRLHKKIDENEKKSEEETKRIFDVLDEIKTGQHSQELVNQKMNFTLDSINREREIDKEAKKENRQDMKKLKYWMLGLIGTLGTSLLVALIRTWLGI